MDPKVKSVIAHITIFGWIVAFLLNNDNKDEYTGFYLRQALGLNLLSLACGVIPFAGWLFGIIVFIFALISIINAAKGDMHVTPLFGNYFQDWFRGF